ncbi:MAG: hypothetical protein ACTS80_01550 [Candidatus Hodgkinia cicadicola]
MNIVVLTAEEALKSRNGGRAFNRSCAWFGCASTNQSINVLAKWMKTIASRRRR